MLPLRQSLMVSQTARDRRRETEPTSVAAQWLEKAVVACLFLFVAFAPHSIAVTQTAWLLGMLFWVMRFAFYPRPRVYRTPIDYALLGFFILTGISSFLSYEPFVSIGKLRAASLFTIVYLFAENIPSRRVIQSLALTLVASCSIGVLYVAGERIVGRGIKLGIVAENSPLTAAAWSGARPFGFSHREPEPMPIRSGDTVLEVDGKPVRHLEELANALTAGPDRASVKIFRAEWVPTLTVPRGRLLPGTTAQEQLGVSGWSTGRDWRASGFYGHYVSYAEVLQLIIALAVGMFVSLPVKRSWHGGLLLLAIAGLGCALALTVTRAPWLAFLVSTSVIFLLGAGRKAILIGGVLAIPLILAGLFILQQKRNVGFLDRTDQSTTWRETVWHDGYGLLTSNPRHLLIGVGMDSIKAHWREWGLFDGGRLPIGHMHSNLLQIALERGIPALIVWLLFLGIYARMLWRLARNPAINAINNWVERGVVLGALGGLCGFFTSGVVHYNWGDSEVVMIFYCIVGLTLALERKVKEAA
ncbi:MAG: O-antigen ligase family protein [Pyrinomonadaceae bacterium]|nr:O-antigen ligase family protein [Pyrinomonadaceae bacterium]